MNRDTDVSQLGFCINSIQISLIILSFKNATSLWEFL